MNVRLIPRTAVAGYIWLIRTPLDSAIGLLPGNGDGPKPAAQLAVDRADATVRSVAGTLLRDPVLLEDGQRRRQAARERERAVSLRSREQQTGETADAQLEQRDEQARQTADNRRRQAETTAQKEREQATKTETRRREASRKAAAKREEAIEDRAPREDLQALEAKSEALSAREAEVAARDEARRLADAATKVRAERKADR